MKVNPLTDCQKYVMRITLKPLEMGRDICEYEFYFFVKRPFAPFGIQYGILSGRNDEQGSWQVFCCWSVCLQSLGIGNDELFISDS